MRHFRGVKMSKFNYYKDELNRLDHTKYHKSLVINSCDFKTKHLSLNTESIPEVIAFLNSELKRLEGVNLLSDILKSKGLKSTEIQVSMLVTKGLSNKEIANTLFVTEKIIKSHLTSIYKKMNVKSRAQLIVWCLPHIGV